MPDIVLYTSGFPYGSAETFLESEIEIISGRFERVYIIPMMATGDQRQVPSNVSILNPILRTRIKKWASIPAGICSIFFFIKLPGIEHENSNLSILKRIEYLGYGLIIYMKTKRRLIRGQNLHYSYWMNYSAFAIAVLKYNGLINTAVCRAHRYDIYDEVGEKSLNFIRPSIIANLDYIFFISQHGLNYLKKRYLTDSSKFRLNRLGTKDHDFVNPYSRANVFSIVSCSAVNNNKRINHIAESLIRISIKRPDVRIRWIHIGGGILLNELVILCEASLKGTMVEVCFPGPVSNDKVFELYRENSFDLFLNVSKSEGIPVSIMEALSFSIPVIAADCGGITEIVNDKVGCLLSSDPDPNEIAAKLIEIYLNRDKWALKRDAARNFWQNNYRASINYTLFSDNLAGLVGEKI